MPSAEVGGDVRRNRALNCWPCVRSLTHSPDAVIHSPAAIVAACPTTRHDIAMPARLGPQHAKAILDVMVRDALDETGKNFLRLILGWVFHTLNSRDAGPNVAACISATVSLLRISAVSRRSSAGGYALVFLCSPLAHLPVASERSAGIENSCLTVVRFTLEIDRDSVARRKCLFERFVE